MIGHVAQQNNARRLVAGCIIAADVDGFTVHVVNRRRAMTPARQRIIENKPLISLVREFGDWGQIGADRRYASELNSPRVCG
jgi:hypothetical protein